MFQVEHCGKAHTRGGETADSNRRQKCWTLALGNWVGEREGAGEWRGKRVGLRLLSVSVCPPKPVQLSSHRNVKGGTPV